MFGFLACALVIVSQDKPAVDRSAEPALRKLFANTSALQNAQFLVQYYGFESRSDRYTLGNSMTVWKGMGKQLRYEANEDMWGGGETLVYDGKVVVRDYMGDDGKVYLGKGKSIDELNKSEPLFYLIEGETAFDRLVQKDKPVKFVAGTSTTKGIEFQTGDLGKVVVYYNEADPFLLPKRIEVYQRAWWMEPNEEVTKATTREVIYLTKVGKLDPDLFSTKPPKGKEVVDQRSSQPD